jgi:hypothetical protein
MKAAQTVKIQPMPAAAKRKQFTFPLAGRVIDLSSYVPADLGNIDNVQTAIPRIAKDPVIVARVENAVKAIPTLHEIRHADARDLSVIPSDSVHFGAHFSTLLDSQGISALEWAARTHRQLRRLPF